MKISSKIALFYFATAVLLAFFLSSTLYIVSQNALNKAIDEHLAEDSELVKEMLDHSDGDIASLIGRKKAFGKYWLKIIKNSDIVYESPIARVTPVALDKITDGATVVVDTEFINFTGDFDVILRLHVKKFSDSTTIIIGLPLDNGISENYKKFIAALAVTLVLISLSAYFLTKFLLRPLKEISLNLRKLNEEKFYKGFIKKSDDEIGYLVEGINITFEKLRNYYTYQKNFLMIMSHELKTPLSVIKNHIEFALARDDVPIDIKSKFSNDLEQISKLNQFIHRLLLLTRLEDNTILPNFSTFNLSELLEEIVLFFTDLAQAQDRRLFFDMESNVMIYGDKELLNRAISNIIDNAVKYTSEGESIHVSLKSTDGNIAALSVKNSGWRIPEEIIAAALNSRFISSIYDGEGIKSGIGLRLIIAILKLHDTAYNLTSDEYINSFEIYLHKAS